MWRLLVPLKYLAIRHPEKLTFDVGLPAAFACLMLLPLLSEKFRGVALTSLDIVSRSSDFLSILTGFFIAALAAVATFGGPEMDEVMPGEPQVTLRHTTHVEQLSRRRFMSFLFGYLAMLSLFLYLFGFAFFGVQDYLVVPTAKWLAPWSFALFWIVFSLLLGNLLSNTLLGLFYLTDRIHRPNRKLMSGKGVQNDEAPPRA